MRSSLVRALTIIAALGNLPAQAGKPFGAEAKKLSEAEANRIGSRITRKRWSANVAMHPAELDRWSRQKRRARQTHPGKRGRRARP